MIWVMLLKVTCTTRCIVIVVYDNGYQWELGSIFSFLGTAIGNEELNLAIIECRLIFLKYKIFGSIIFSRAIIQCPS